MMYVSRSLRIYAFLGLLYVCFNVHSAWSQTTAGYRGAAEPATAPEIYGQGVRETDWKSPAIEKRGFHLPPGFEIELFASEPQVSKPLNMAWDARGRLWVTCTVEYPYPAKEGVIPRDTIRILEDTDQDGRADKVTIFADELNIPMGLLPVEDGVICFSIPSLWYLKDNDGDDHVDEKIQLLGPFDTTRDTHGMVNSLSRGSDGWIYACHGFNNQSQVTAQDGSSVTMHSGNTFRFKQDGSSIEHFTHGQVNPFGLTRDEWGNWYSADCHSKPLTALLPGAFYPSFGRPHDGLGFAPDMMQHLHGSTAICGLVYYQAEHFPAAYRHLFFSGNVMTSRINCNAGQWSGATVSALEQPDFLTSDDPWFRPVDIQLGHDGALYVADFYNKIIGHYEVPLEHPERDRESGRIWRIVYHGTEPHRPLASPRSEIQNNGLYVVAKQLSSSNLTVRRSIIEQLTQEAEPSQEAFVSMLQYGEEHPLLLQSALEILHRRGQLEPQVLSGVMASAAPAELRVLALWLAGEQKPEVLSSMLPQLRDCLSDTQHPQVRKAAMRCLGLTGDASDVSRLLRVLLSEKDNDRVLAQAAKIAVRQLLRNDRVLSEATAAWSNAAVSADGIGLDSPLALPLVDILPAVDSPKAAHALLGYLAARGDSLSSEQLERTIAFATKYADAEIAKRLLAAISQLTEGDLQRRAELFVQLVDAAQAKQNAIPTEVMSYGASLLEQLIAEATQRLSVAGKYVDWADELGQGWNVEDRVCDDQQSASLTSSLSRSEKYIGVLRSEVFECPSELIFWLAGHNGFPEEVDHRKNKVRLVQASTGQTLGEAFPPRSDVAEEVTWPLQDFAGQPVRVEVIDDDSGTAYAWLAVGRFSLPELRPGNSEPVLETIAGLLQRGVMPTTDLATQFRRAPLSQRQLAKLIAATLTGRKTQPNAILATQALALGRADVVQIDLLNKPMNESEQLRKLAAELCATATARQQAEFAKVLLTTPTSCELLSDLLERGTLSLQALRGLQPLLPSGLATRVRERLELQISKAASLPSEAVDVAGRVAKLNWEAATIASGQAVYKQHCAQCHQFGTEGNLVGPQLDGVKLRGAARLCEDILDPNRNVDLAFRQTSLLLDDDSVLAGMVREEADGGLTIVGQDGKSRTLVVGAIVERRVMSQSLMPANFGELLDNTQLASLLKFLAEAR
jgi:putative heme-binding domain-containing protein